MPFHPDSAAVLKPAVAQRVGQVGNPASPTAHAPLSPCENCSASVVNSVVVACQGWIHDPRRYLFDLTSGLQKSALQRQVKPLVTGLLLTLAGCTQSQPNFLVPFSPSLTQLEWSVPPTPPADRAKAGELRAAGLSYRDRAQWDTAIATLEEAIALDPQELSGYVILGWTQHLAGETAAAKATLSQALERDGNHVPALNALGIVYLVDGQLEQAVVTHTHALSLKPDNEIAAYNLSLAYQRLGDYESAIAMAEQATELEPDNPHPWVALAIAQASAENASAAEQAYQTALSLDGRYGDRAFLAHLEQAGFSADQIQQTEAVLEGF